MGGADTFDQAIASFAEAYADVNARDHAAYLDGDQGRAGCRCRAES